MLIYQFVVVRYSLLRVAVRRQQELAVGVHGEEEVVLVPSRGDIVTYGLNLRLRLGEKSSKSKGARVTAGTNS